ncbi:hypothetical protein X777_11674 [Ooceraea biroi]|uniref:Uncharacterized protein n=1 Tax=Ooceraea biroi TaxID=2015173 RepID=A0A026W2H9_OOCBI|nr:hypothetical protein X777_11674 [Ooceraea biroi]
MISDVRITLVHRIRERFREFRRENARLVSLRVKHTELSRATATVTARFTVSLGYRESPWRKIAAEGGRRRIEPTIARITE